MGSSVILPAPGQPKTGADPAFKTAATPNIVTFGLERIGPPSALYVQRDDVLVISAASSVATTVNIVGRQLLAPFPIAGQPDKPSGADPKQTPASSNMFQLIGAAIPITAGNLRTAQVITLPLTEGYLLSLGATTINGGQRGVVFVRAVLVRGAGGTASFTGTEEVLFADYITTLHPAAWPGGRQLYPTESTGALLTLNQANPAAGADWNFTNPIGARTNVFTLSSVLTTSATVANRNVELIVDDGSNIVWRTSAAASIAAATAQTLSATGTNNPTGVVTTDSQLVIPPGLLLGGGWRIRTLTTGIQVGDQWSAIWLAVQQWLDSL